MFTSILVGTDGSETAHTALLRAIDLAAGLGARLQIVSAYEPVSDQRLRGEEVNVPADLQWMINPHDDVLALLEQARTEATEAGVKQVETFARQGDAGIAVEQLCAGTRHRQHLHIDAVLIHRLQASFTDVFKSWQGVGARS